MYGFQNLASQQQQRFWVYTGNKNTSGFQTWIKPPGISFIHIIAIGAGGGGAGAFPFSAGSAARGGGGGGGGSMNSTFLPAYLVPDTLYVNIGIGGAGGAASTVVGTANVGSTGNSTYVGFYPIQTAAYTLCMANPGSGGGAPTAGGGGGGGGNPGATATSTFFPTSQVGLRTYTGGQTGGQAVTNGAATAITAEKRVTSGGGGSGNSVGNVIGTGASINVASLIAAIAASPAGTNGSQFTDLINFIFSGGTGASSSTTISGSNGGSGGYGCGGGGGGVGPGRGGAGGAGGDGLVIITCG